MQGVYKVALRFVGASSLNLVLTYKPETVLLNGRVYILQRRKGNCSTKYDILALAFSPPFLSLVSNNIFGVERSKLDT